jgi:hypothetical protein
MAHLVDGTHNHADIPRGRPCGILRGGRAAVRGAAAPLAVTSTATHALLTDQPDFAPDSGRKTSEG